MPTTGTQSQSYTVADVGRVLDQFAADFDGISQSTGLRTRDDVKAVSEDVKRMAARGYLREVNLCLFNEAGAVMRAAKYTVNTSTGVLTASRPGAHLWPRTPGGQLSVVVHYSDAWKTLSEAAREAFHRELNRNWTTSGIDTSFPTLRATADRNYVSNGYGLQRSTYQ
ncbi:MAG TPA: hypothetical protein VF613_10090 [Longimicrobium sp.]|jgi:hypothetical protein